MKRRITFFAFVLLFLSFCALAYADVVWPALYLISRTFSWWAILLGLVIEYLFVRKLASFGVSKSILIDLSMNGFSTLWGAILIPIAGIAWEIFPGSILYKIFNIGTFNPGTWAATVLFAVVINAYLENFVIAKFFKCRLGWRGFWWLSLANGVSVLVAFGSLFY